MENLPFIHVYNTKGSAVMSNDIISAVENELTPEFIDNVSTYLQEDKASVLSAFSDIIPYVLNKVCSYLEHREQQGELLSLIHNAPEPDLHTMPLHSVLKKMELNGVITEFFSMIMPASVTETQFSGIMTGVKSGVKSSYFSLAALLLLKQMKRYLQSRTGQSVSLKQWLMTSQHHVVRSPDVTPQHQMNAKEDLSRKTGKKVKESGCCCCCCYCCYWLSLVCCVVVQPHREKTYPGQIGRALGHFLTGHYRMVKLLTFLKKV